MLGLATPLTIGPEDPPPTADPTTAAFDYEHAHFERSDLCHFTRARVQEFIRDVDLPRSWFPGKRVLDAGCGSGRWSYALAELGARVTAIDASGAGVKATQAMFARGEYPGCTAKVATLEQLPAALGQPTVPLFDLVLSWGVLHHTSQPAVNFQRLAHLVAPGGFLKVMVYEQNNPTQEATTNLVRRIMRHMTSEQRYAACAELLIADENERETLWPAVYVYGQPPEDDPVGRARLQFAAYDAYSPEYNFRFRYEAVLLWFLAAGLTEVVLQSPPLNRGLNAALFGPCGGAVHVRGRRPAVSA